MKEIRTPGHAWTYQRGCSHKDYDKTTRTGPLRGPAKCPYLLEHCTICQGGFCSRPGGYAAHCKRSMNKLHREKK